MTEREQDDTQRNEPETDEEREELAQQGRLQQTEEEEESPGDEAA